MTTPTPGQPLSEADVSPCTDCDGTGITTQSERPCSCSAGDAYRPHAPVSRPGDGVEGGGRKRIDYGKPGDPSGCYFPKEWRLLSRAREYVADALDAHEHSDGRVLINEIDAALTPPAEPVSRPAGEGETTQHTPRCWGRTSYSDEMAHCYCKPAGEGEREAVARVTETAYRDEAKAVMVRTDDLRSILSLLSPAAPDAGGGALGPLGEESDSALKIATDLHAAYEQLIYGLPKYLDTENLTDEDNMIREAYITLDTTAHRLAALQPGGER